MKGRNEKELVGESKTSIESVALVGAPNTGKTTIFNRLTGLQQKTGNFNGVTVELAMGQCLLNDQQKVTLVDLPGFHSLYPASEDEKVAIEALTKPTNTQKPDAVIVVVGEDQLKEGLILATQIRDLGYRMLIALHFFGQSETIAWSLDQLGRYLEVPIIPINARSGKGLSLLKNTLSKLPTAWHDPFLDSSNEQAATNNGAEAITELAQRSKKIDQFLSEVGYFAAKKENEELKRSLKIDRWLLHPLYGYAIMILVFFTIFQLLFTLAAYPMDWIDAGAAMLNQSIDQNFPNNFFTDLLTQGVIPGIAGVVVFIPQIAILFFLLTLLEECGYMARVMHLNDRFLRKAGMNGKSAVPLLSGLACAIPAIMSARTIANPRERLITILVTPFMGCSARLPVYVLLISLAVPDTSILGVVSLQGLVMLGLYLLGFVAALLLGFVLSLMLEKKALGSFILDFPVYRIPNLQNAFAQVVSKTKVFVVDAGKIIFVLSIVLWVLASYSPYDEFDGIGDKLKKQYPDLNEEELATKISSKKLELSYAGQMGSFIEPAIRPLGFNWQIGISLVTSFAAREVFVGTMSTLFALGEDTSPDEGMIKNLSKAKDTDGGRLFDFPTTMSLLLFYVLAMQCMSTFAIVKRETNSWKWPIIQLFIMTGSAYLLSFLVFQLLS